MTRADFLASYGTWYPGAMYGDVHPTGAQVRLYFGSHLETHRGRVDFPAGAGLGVLFPRLTIVGGFRFAGQLHGTPNTNAEWIERGGWVPRPSTYEGMSPCIYDLDARLWQNGLDEYVGAGGYRHIGERTDAAPGGERISADATVLLAEAELSEVSPIGPDLYIGQGHPDAARNHCWLWHRPTKTHRLLIDQSCWFIRATVDGDQVALYIPVINEGAWIVICPIAALLELPVGVMPGAQLPEPIGPRSAPRSHDGRVYDLLTFILGDPSTWPRGGPTHAMHQPIGPEPGLFHFVKFDERDRYETWAHDDHWIYHLEDASPDDPYSFDDPRWFPRRMAIGEAHAFDSGEHLTAFRRRRTCEVIRREPFRRRMWVEAIYDRFYWGPDLGERATMVVAYDPTGGIHIAARGVELGYYAHGAGSVRWEWYHSDQVYPRGATRAQFSDTARGARSDFYLKGGLSIRPNLTGCVPQVVPHAEPWEPDPEKEPDPMPPPVVSLHDWIHVEYPQLVQAYRDTHDGAEPGHEWAAFQTYRRYLEPNVWTFPRMLAWERSQGTGGGAGGGGQGGEAVQLTTDGRFFVSAETGAAVRLLFASQLALCVRSADQRQARYEEMRGLGFNGFRVFAGDLGWAGQTPAAARTVLPTILDEAAAHGLYVYVCAITGGKDPVYDVEPHLREVIAICAGRPNVLLEGANEIGHPTLSDRVTVPWLNSQLARLAPREMLWTPGAPLHTDEPDPSGEWVGAGGRFSDAHLDRGRDKWNQVRRLRELFAIAEVTRKPVMNGEMIGADERMGGDTGTRQRRNDPDFFFAAGVLSRGFELSTVFHSQAGLMAEPLGPVQTECARAFVQGFTCIPTTDRLTFGNAGWPGSPVKAADFDALIRAYSFIAGDRGWTVLLGIRGDPRVEWGGGWRPGNDVAGTDGPDGRTRVVEITK
jgi:hypothetical protein